MLIRELTREESVGLLTRVRLGRLACARANQPYLFPLFFAYFENSLYCASTGGQKIEWMRENPMVAFEADEIHSAQQWESVIISGRYEELAKTPETRDERQLAWSLLQKHELWWEPGYVKTITGGVERPITLLYFRISIERITGHRATLE